MPVFNRRSAVFGFTGRRGARLGLISAADSVPGSAGACLPAVYVLLLQFLHLSLAAHFGSIIVYFQKSQKAFFYSAPVVCISAGAVRRIHDFSL